MPITIISRRYAANADKIIIFVLFIGSPPLGKYSKK